MSAQPKQHKRRDDERIDDDLCLEIDRTLNEHSEVATVDFMPAVAFATPVVQVALMGVIGYSYARRSPARMDRFHRSGFQWWLVALAAVIVGGLIFQPQLLEPTTPSKHEVTVLQVLVVFAAGLAALVAIELGAERLRLGGSNAVAKDRQKYDAALPAWAKPPAREAGVLTLVAIAEEAVYRGLLLGGAILLWGASEPLAAGLSAGAFGAAHWYFGARQIVIKSLLGAVLVTVALASGWVVAAAAHVGLNLVLLVLERRLAILPLPYP